MYFEQFYLTCHSHASYMLGSEGVAAVVDPQRDVDLYLDEARTNNLLIEHVIETHLHADFVSGRHELAAKTGARIHLRLSRDDPRRSSLPCRRPDSPSRSQVMDVIGGFDAWRACNPPVETGKAAAR